MKVSLHINFNHIAFNNPFYSVFLLFLIGQKCIFYYINSSKTSSFSPGVEYIYIYIYIDTQKERKREREREREIMKEKPKIKVIFFRCYKAPL